MLSVPFALFCLPETKGLPLESILPMFAYGAGDKGFTSFARGNMRRGCGALKDAVPDNPPT